MARVFCTFHKFLDKRQLYGNKYSGCKQKNKDHLWQLKMTGWTITWTCCRNVNLNLRRRVTFHRSQRSLMWSKVATLNPRATPHQFHRNEGGINIKPTIAKVNVGFFYPGSFIHLCAVFFDEMTTPSDAGGFYHAGRAGVSVSRTQTSVG